MTSARHTAHWIVIACFMAASASAADTPGRRLIVVIWERRAPQTENMFEDYGNVQRRNRETILSLLYDGKKLAGENPFRTSIAIFPEGMPRNEEATAESYGALTSAAPDELDQSWLPRMLSIGSPSDPLQPIYFLTTPAKIEMSNAIRRSITDPLTGVTALDPDESSGRPVAGATRSVSHPPLVTPYALYHAANQLRLRDEPWSEVYVVWVHGGERNYAINIPQHAIRRDYGEHCAAYYRQSRAMYVMEPDETHSDSGELADGNITVWRVQRRIATQDPVAPALMSGREPASFDRRKATLDVSMLHPEIGARLREANISTVRFVRWRVEYPDSRLKPIDAVTTFHRSGLTYALPLPTDAIPIGELVDDATLKAGVLSFSDSVDVKVRFDSAEPLPAHLQRIALRIP
ncbi:MAG TPA: hypothetical protein VF057_11075, partial [Thermoanaerobaculia bacterium]